MESLADYDIIWKGFASKADDELKAIHLNQVIEAQAANSKDRWLSKESRTHALKVLTLAKSELEKI